MKKSKPLLTSPSKSKPLLSSPHPDSDSTPSLYTPLKDALPPPPLSTTSTPSPSPSSSNPFHRIPKRYLMCGLILASNILCYADRTNISIAVLPGNIPLRDEFQTGQVLAGFFYGYIVTQFMGGVLANRYGGKPVLLVGVLLWVLCDALTVPASRLFPLLMLARVGMGLGEGVNFPADHAMIAAWFVQQERSGFLGLISAGVDIGTIISSGLSPIIAANLGWEWIYGIYCGLGLLWLSAFALLGSSKPEWHPTISAEERAFILAHRSGHADAEPLEPPSPYQATVRTPSPLPSPFPSPAHSRASATSTWYAWFLSLLSPPDHPVPWARLFSSPSLYGIICAHVCFNYGFYVMLSWLPQYYVHRGTSLKEGGFFSISMPYIAGAIGGPVSGYLSNRLIGQGWRIRSVRVLMNSLGSVGASGAMFVIAFVPPQSTALATAVLSLGYFFFRFSFSGYWANMVDIAHSHAGEVMGISNTIATVPGMVGNLLTGAILKATGNWGLVFFLAGVAYMLAGVSFFWLCDDVDIGEMAARERREGRGGGQGGKKIEMAEENGYGGEEEENGEGYRGEERAINVGRSSLL